MTTKVVFGVHLVLCCIDVIKTTSAILSVYMGPKCSSIGRMCRSGGGQCEYLITNHRWHFMLRIVTETGDLIGLIVSTTLVILILIVLIFTFIMLCCVYVIPCSVDRS